MTQKETIKQLTIDKSALEVDLKITKRDLLKYQIELSKVLGAGQKQNPYGDNKQLTYSWQEIFTEIGKLLVKKDRHDNKNDITFLIDSNQRIQEEMQTLRDLIK